MQRIQMKLWDPAAHHFNLHGQLVLEWWPDVFWVQVTPFSLYSGRDQDSNGDWKTCKEPEQSLCLLPEECRHKSRPRAIYHLCSQPLTYLDTWQSSRPGCTSMVLCLEYFSPCWSKKKKKTHLYYSHIEEISILQQYVDLLKCWLKIIKE